MKIRIASTGLATVFALTCLLVSPVQAAKLYKWVDQDGNVSYQDTPPPASAKSVEESELPSTAPQAQEETDQPPLVVYTTENCNSCELLLVRLRQLQLPVVEQSLLNKDIQAEILAQSESLSAPTLRIGDQYINEFAEPRLSQLLREAGYQPNSSGEERELPGTSTDGDDDQD